MIVFLLVLFLLSFSYIFKGDNMFYYDGKILRIMNYQKINFLEEDKIELSFGDNVILYVSGSDLKIIFLEPQELHLAGNIELIKKQIRHEKD